MTKRFQRNIENFVCEHCGAGVKGDGYTNHCPKCLYSKHVDVNPGDRAETCNGMMPPIKIELEKGEYILTHKCEKCGLKKRNKISANDDMEAVISLAKTLAKP